MQNTCQNELSGTGHYLHYPSAVLRSLRPTVPLPPPADLSFIKPRKRGRKGGVKAKCNKRRFRPFLPSIVCGNVRSIKNKIDELSALCKYSHDFSSASIIALTETWLTENTPSQCFNIDNFTLHRADRTGTKKTLGGGVCAYINNKWCHPNNSSIKTVYCDNNIEILIVCIRPYYLPREFTHINLINVYIPPSGDKKAATDTLLTHINKEENTSPDSVIVVTGDFNQCGDVTFDGYEQFVNCPTRGNSILDLFFCNVKRSYKCVVKPPLGASDHNMLLLRPLYKPMVRRVKPVKKCVRVWNECVRDELRGCFESTDWDIFIENSECVDELNDCVCEYIKFCEDIVCETKEIFIYPNNKPWVTKELKYLLNKKKYYFFMGDAEKLRTTKKELKSEIAKSKNKYKQKIEKSFSSNNMKDTWAGLKTIGGLSERKGDIPHDIDIDELNKFYCRFDSTDYSEIQKTLREKIENNLDNECEINISETETKTIFSRLSVRKAAGPDGLKPNILKSCAEELSPIYTFIFNLSLYSTCIPVMWKTSSVIPVPKKNKVSVMNDLRPVALTSVVMKCLEKILLLHINVPFRSNIDSFQFAYQPKRSVEDALLTFTNNIYSHLDLKNSYCRVLFVDFSSAFNTMQPHLLISKLLELKLNNFITAWVLEFLTGRKQYVTSGSRSSNVIITNTGAPQGCVLSPVLFTIYTNDCKSIHPDAVPLLKFADDTALQGLIINNDETKYRDVIKSFVSWCDGNQLELNVGKTKEMVFDFRKCKTTHDSIVIKDQSVEQVRSYKYLGVTVDNHLKWSDHVKQIKSKVNKRFYFLSKLVNFKIDRTICTMFYRSMMESVFAFCISVWGGNVSAKDRHDIIRTIKRASRVTNSIDSFDSLYERCCLHGIIRISEDDSHPLYPLLRKSERSGRVLSIRTKSERHRRSFLPSGVRLLNAHRQ